MFSSGRVGPHVVGTFAGTGAGGASTGGGAGGGASTGGAGASAGGAGGAAGGGEASGGRASGSTHGDAGTSGTDCALARAGSKMPAVNASNKQRARQLSRAPSKGSRTLPR